jgi:hypothetical protein
VKTIFERGFVRLDDLSVSNVNRANVCFAIAIFINKLSHLSVRKFDIYDIRFIPKENIGISTMCVNYIIFCILCILH